MDGEGFPGGKMIKQSKNQSNRSIKLCPHCKMDLSIRNPSGFCDHLYYPDYCKVCQAIVEAECFFCTHKVACNRTKEGCKYIKGLVKSV